MRQYELFLNSLRSPATKRAYDIYFRKYQEFMGSADLFCQNNPRLVEEKIIEFIVSLRERSLSYSAIRNYMMTIISFYKINDVLLRTDKISRFLPEYKKVKKDRAYTHEEISKLLEIADTRMRAVILILASSGVRIGALSELRLSSIEGQKITVYEGTKDEYITWMTVEAKAAVDAYLDMRARYGERITENSYLIREQFDVRNPGKPKGTVANTLYGKLRDLSKRSGIKDKNLPVCNSFRKFFCSQLLASDLKTELRWLLEGHNLKGNDSSYVRVSEKHLYEEYEKAINNLTINEENRLSRELEEMKQDQDEIALMKLEHKKDMKELRQQTDEKLDRIISLMQANPKLAKVKREVLSNF